MQSTYFAGEDVSDVFAVKEITAENVNGISATANGKQVTVEFSVNKKSPDGFDAVSLLTKEYVTLEKFNTKVAQYGAGSTGTTINVKDVKLKAVIDYSTGNFASVEISFNTGFYIGELNLEYVYGGPIKASTRTVIQYTDFKEN